MKQKLTLVITLSTAITLGSLSCLVVAQNESVDDATPPAPRHMIRKHMKERLEQMDTNKDGQIDLNEYLSHAEKRFAKLDANGDGFITKQERRKAHKEMRERVRDRRKQWREHREQIQDADNS